MSSEPVANTGQHRPSNPRRRWLTLALSSAVLFGGFWWLLGAGGLPVLPTGEALWRIGWSGVVFYSAIWLVTLTLKAWRWSFQLAPLAPVPWFRVYSASWVGAAALLVLPFKTGELTRPALISRGTPLSFFAAVSTNATERIVDAVFSSVLLIVCLPLAHILDPLPDRIGQLPVPAKLVPVFGYSFAVLALCAVGAVVVFYVFRDACKRLISATLGRLWPRASNVVQSKLGELAEGFGFLSSPRHAVGYLLATAIFWTLYVLGIWYLLRASGFPGLTLAQAGVVSGTLAFSFSLPNVPGFFGSFQVAVYAALAALYPVHLVQDAGSTAVFWLYVLQIGWSLALAVPGGFIERNSIVRASTAA